MNEQSRQEKGPSVSSIFVISEAMRDHLWQMQENLLSISNSIVSLYERDLSAFTEALSKSIEICKITQIATEAISPQITQFLSSMDSFTRTVTSDLAALRIAFESVRDSDAIRRLGEQLELDEKTVEAFNAANWPISPSMPGSLRKRVVAMYQEGKAGYATQTILGHYRKSNNKHLIDMVNTWRAHPLFGPRMHIIEDALRAHREGRFALSVPALIPQIEGILNDYVMAHSLDVELGKIKTVYQTAIGDPDEHTWPVWSIASSLLYHLGNNTYAYTDFENELRKSVRRRSTTRHTVMHGIAVGYDREMHSLRAFLLLDSISALELPE